ncbi:type I-E CRISPR-associated protein Cse1/CasA [Corynebacterium hindlerae]|uniref:Type I-E CRISPR-associated protein Cse1/CasA n=1 Tax=Corynebacterium hindlerae TaxID=699041 RepID=A0A7G5FCW3_9CORY|nr:type I-E CRISPR-associated protein Cse1/CasA [Corynebacterium hindlerae]QMV84454.1 type I-E CRISPR-associated protein Cse1/CasA [Corynebacterium hindlerae]
MFNLIDEPWILVVVESGETRLVGLREIFAGEVKIIALRGDSAIQDYAIARLLYAIFCCAHREEVQAGPGKKFDFPQWFAGQLTKVRRRGKDVKALEYLEKYHDRFNLFHEVMPFMQVSGLRVKSGEVKHVTTIVPEAQEDYFSMRAGTERNSLTFAEAARWLVYVQAFDYSGIKSGAEGDSRVKGGKGYPIGTGWAGMTGGTLVKGETLLETLLLNTTAEALSDRQDKPVWERAPYGADSRETVGENPLPQGPVDLATWQSRRVRLHAKGNQVVGVVLANGDKIPDAGANVMADTMTPYRYSTNKSKKNFDVYFPRPYDMNRTMWKALDSLVIAETDGGFSGKEKAPKRPKNLDNLAKLSQLIDGIPPILNLNLVSVEYGPQASSVATTYSSQMRMPVLLLLEESEQLRIEVRSLAKSTYEAAIVLGRFAGDLLDAAGGTYEFQPAVTDRALAELEPLFNHWLQKIQKTDHEINFDSRSRQWQHAARDCIDAYARILLRGAGPKALAGRMESEESNRVISAATCYQKLQRALNKLFPLTELKENEQ